MPSCQMHFESRGLKRSLHKGPSINDATQERREGVQKMGILGDFQGETGVKRGDRGLKN